MSKTARKNIWGPTEKPDSWSGEPVPEQPVQPPALPIKTPAPPEAVSILEQLRVVEKKPRDRGWEKREDNRPMLFRRVPPSLREAIKEVAEDLQVRVDDVARAFLEFGLQCHQKGELKIEPVLSEGRMTLFPRSGNPCTGSAWRGWEEKVEDRKPPEKKPRRVRSANTGEEKPWRWQAAYRGLPPEVQAALREIHQAESVPLGEVAALLLSHALDAYQTGRLVLKPQPRQAPSVSVDTQTGSQK